MNLVDDPDLDRRRSDWETDEWDEVGEVPAVETLRRQTRIVKWVVWLALVLIAVLIIVAGYVGWWYLGKVQPESVDGGSGAPVAFTVVAGDDIDSLSERLEADGLVVDASVFRWYVERQGGLEITPGFYQLPVGDHMGNVLSRLRTPPDQTYRRVTFPEGFTLEQMAERLEEEMPRLSADAFLDAANSLTVPARLRNPSQASLEGLLFPDTYQISNADNEAQVVERMIGIMERVADQEELEVRAANLSRTPYEILVIASMIEKEAKLDEDRPKIARVIYNRLLIGMNLQIDATLYYENDPDGGVPFSVLRQVPGPYNSYLSPGLPPTPIANPGRASIRAALNPAPNPPPGDPICQALDDPTVDCLYLFYVLANEEGGHAFAATAEQHQQNVNAAAAAGLLG